MLLIAASAFADRDGNGMDRGGGGEGAQEFRAAGSAVLAHLERWAAAGTLEPELAAIDRVRLRAAIEGTLIVPAGADGLTLRVDVCAYHPDLTELQNCSTGRARRLRRMRVTAISTLGGTIQLDEVRWQSWDASETRYAIALHEYMGTYMVDERLYETTAVYLAHRARENDAERFRIELAGRLRTLAVTMRTEIAPDLASLTLLVSSMRVAAASCFNAPRGTDRESMLGRLDACQEATRIMNATIESMREALSRLPTAGVAQAALTNYRAWAAALPEPERIYALDLEDMLTMVNNQVVLRNRAAQAAFFESAGAACPWANTEGLECLFPLFESFVTETYPEVIRDGYIDFDVNCSLIESFAQDYVAR